MHFALLCWDSGVWDRLSPSEQSDAKEAFGTWVRELKEQGVFVSGWPVNEASLVLDGSSVFDLKSFFWGDGLGALFVIECPTLEDAVEYAQGCPTLALKGRVEVRPLTH
ncbi:MAG: YciI family protein [Fimbriimonadaceae bacterium]|jgi:hypothetical protein|nr:YciI family protein [Fimbriimonadaceae bacterium]